MLLSKILNSTAPSSDTCLWYSSQSFHDVTNWKAANNISVRALDKAISKTINI